MSDKDFKCEYCGGEPVGSWMASMSSGMSIMKAEKEHFFCEPCMRELAEFDRRPENVMPDDFDTADEARLEQISQQLAERERRKQEFMRQKVRERLR
jgi:hypothetical protein